MKTIVPRLVLALGAVCAGCVTLTAQQQDKVAEVQRFADAATAAYRLSRIRVTIEPATNLGVGARYRQGNFYLNVRMLNAPSLTAIVAHELGHYVLGHEALVGIASQAEWQRAQELRELDANAAAVEILVRAAGLTEREALQTMIDYLRAAQRGVDAGGPIPSGHRAPVEEIADLLARFGDRR